MDFKNLKSYVNAVAKEKDLDVEIIKEAIESALLSASKKSLSNFRDARVNLDMESGDLKLLVKKDVVDKVENDRMQITRREARKVLKDKKIEVDDEVEVPIDPSAFGRIAAQSARQIVMQRIRDAERSKIFNEFSGRKGEVVTGTVQRFERRDVVMNIGRADGILPLYEQPMGARYKHNDRLKVIIQDVRETPKGPVIVLSRKSPELVIKLFEAEVPEIADGTIKILGVAREPGVRTKIAVQSSSSDVDPVGACVGMKGSRVQMVVRELDNEKIDIVPYSIDPKRFIGSALNPAQIQAINLDERHKRAEVVVAQGNLAIAIGRKGQNTKLAARLTGWRLDIRSEEEDGLNYDEIQKRYLEDFLMQVADLSELSREAILRSEMNTVEKIATSQIETLMNFTSDNAEVADALQAGAAEYMEALQEIQAERKRRGLAPGFFMPSEFIEGKEDESAAEEGDKDSDETADEAKDDETSDETGEDESSGDAESTTEEDSEEGDDAVAESDDESDDADKAEAEEAKADEEE